MTRRLGAEASARAPSAARVVESSSADDAGFECLEDQRLPMTARPAFAAIPSRLWRDQATPLQPERVGTRPSGSPGGGVPEPDRVVTSACERLVVGRERGRFHRVVVTGTTAPPTASSTRRRPSRQNRCCVRTLYRATRERSSAGQLELDEPTLGALGEHGLPAHRPCGSWVLLSTSAAIAVLRCAIRSPCLVEDATQRERAASPSYSEPVSRQRQSVDDSLKDLLPQVHRLSPATLDRCDRRWLLKS